MNVRVLFSVPDPTPRPPSSPALRRGRIEVGLVETYERDGEPRRREFRTGRFATAGSARAWAIARLLELVATEGRTDVSAVLTAYSSRDGWKAHDLGRVTLEDAFERLAGAEFELDAKAVR